MEITENSLFEAFGMEQPAEAPKDTTQTETEPIVDTETVDTVETETETEPDTQPESTEQSADERRQNAARRRQQEQQAAIDKAVAEARADEQAKAKKSQEDFFKRAKLKNTLTGADITSLDEFDTWERDFNQKKLERDLKAGKLSPETLQSAIESSPTVQAAKQIVEREQSAQQQAQQQDFQAQIDAEIAEISKFDPSIKTTADLLTMPNSKEFYDYVQKGLSFTDAYFLVNREKVQTATAQAAKNSALSNQRGKDHLTGANGSRGSGAKTVPNEDLAMFKLFNPNATPEEIQTYYNKYKK